MKKFIFNKFAYSRQLYYQMNSFTGIFQQHFKPPMLLPCIDLSPYPHQILKNPSPLPHRPHVFNTCGKPWSYTCLISIPRELSKILVSNSALCNRGSKRFYLLQKQRGFFIYCIFLFLSSGVYFMSKFFRQNTFFLDLWYTKLFLSSFGTFAYFAEFFFFLICQSIHLTLLNHIITHMPQVLQVLYLNK